MLAIDSHLTAIFKLVVEAMSKRPRGGCRRDEEVACVMRTWYPMGWRGRATGRYRRRFKVSPIPSIRPIGVIDEERSPFFLGQAIAHPQAHQRSAHPCVFSLHHKCQTPLADFCFAVVIHTIIPSHHGARRTFVGTWEQSVLLGIFDIHKVPVF